MATTVSGSSAEPETFADDLAGIGSFFVDPQELLAASFTNGFGLDRWPFFRSFP